MVCEAKVSEKLLCCFAEGAKQGCVAVLNILLLCTQKYIFATHRHNCAKRHAYTKDCAFGTIIFILILQNKNKEAWWQSLLQSFAKMRLMQKCIFVTHSNTTISLSPRKNSF
jgi:hypothetical protein